MTGKPAGGVLVARVVAWQVVVATFGSALVAGIFALPVAAATLAIPGQISQVGLPNPPSVTIGTLSANVTGAGVETATFTLNQQFRNLMSDANGAQFRFFQVITYYSTLPSYNPTTHMGGSIGTNGAAVNTADVVDTPSGGWNYEWTMGNKGGDDTSPFYETDVTNNPATLKPYFGNPGGDYPTLHSADGVNPGTMGTGDAPQAPAGDSFQFATYITYENPSLIASKVVDILGGYTWGVQTTAAGVQTGTSPTYIPYSGITLAMLTQFDAALTLSGFAGWGANAGDGILATYAPEPSSLTLVALAGTLCGAWGLTRRGFGRRRDRGVKL